MDLGQILYELFFDYTLRTVALGSAILGLVSGVLGTFAVLRKQSLLGDAISHAALPGVAIAFLLTGSKEPIVLVLGAVIAGWIGTLFVMLITKHTRIKQDSALGIVLAVFFGFGMLLLSFIQRLPTASKAGLDKFLFGQAATLVEQDVATMATLGGVAVIILLLLWKEFKLLSFDPDFASSLGYSVRFLDILLTTLTVIAIVVGLQTVGVVLMSAMLVSPAAAARQWTQRLDRMVLLAGFFGALVGLLGAVTSSQVAKLPTGPAIVLYMSVIVLLSLLMAPERGLIAQARTRRRQKVQFAAEALTVHLLHHEGTPEEERESALSHMGEHMRWAEDFAQKVARWSVTNGMVTRVNGHLQLTSYGREIARRAMVRT
ncbi:MAG: metal ABC transporter permease [Anaerolineae bacterium]|nr:metal ABC transporter permease [Anaerolineae bacterium]